MKLESTLRSRRGFLHFASLLDILFLVLLFFLLSSNAVVRSGIAVTVPQSHSALQAVASADIITLSGGTPSQIFFNDRLVTTKELEYELADGSGPEGHKQVVLRADQAAPYGQVIKISNIVVGSGHSLILATRPEITQ
jgi:biopolymer transport protein ExbD